MIFEIYKWQCNRITRVSMLRSLNCLTISVRFMRFFLSFSFTTDKISKLFFFFTNNFDASITTKKKLTKRKKKNIETSSVSNYTLLFIFLFWKLSVALKNSLEPEQSVTTMENLNHSYLANRFIIASAWWCKVDASWISFFLGRFFSIFFFNF